MLRKIATAAAVLGFGVSALAAGFDGKTLATNDWFDADFTTGIAVGSAVVANSTTGITYGAGSWTSVPATGTATIVADSDAGEGATMLAINAPGEELTFTPDAQGSPTGMETSSLLVKGDAVDELPAMGADVQAAFAICDDGTAAVPCGYTAAGWTNLVYSGAMSGLTNAWCTVYVDFANVENVRYVRYSVQPAGGDVTVLADAGGTTWFQAGCNATTITSVSLSGTGSCRTINGDRLVETVSYVATYNGVSYQTLEDALAAGLADNWANGSVILVDDVTWRPTVRGAKYLIDRGAYTLDIVDASVSVSENNITNTVNGLTYYWIGGGTGSWTETANWSLYDGGAAGGAYPNSYVNNKTYAYDSVVFTSDATVTVDGDRYAVAMTAGDGATVTLTGGGSIKTAYSSNNGKFQLLGAGTFRMNGVRFVLPYATSWKDTATIETPIVVAGTSNTIYLADSTSPNTRYSQLTLSTAISGSGELKFDTPYLNQSRLYLGSADFSGFTGTMTIQVQTPTLLVQGGGKYVIGSNSVAGGLSTVTFSGACGTLAFADGVEGDISAAIKNSTAAITVDTGAADFTWTTALASSNIGGLVKKGQGTLTLSEMPAYVGTTTVEGGTLVVPQGTTIAELAIDGGKLVVPLDGTESETPVLTISALADGTTAEDLETAVAIAGATMAVEAGGSGYVVKATRNPQTFTWTGAVDADWAKGGNWTVGGVTATAAPLAIDTVSFTDVAAVAVDATASAANILLSAAVTMSGSGKVIATNVTASGSGLLRVAGITMSCPASSVAPKGIAYNTPIEVVGGTTNTFTIESSMTSSQTDYRYLYFNGDIIGSGYMRIDQRSRQGLAGGRFSGDNSGFSGAVEVVNCKDNRDTTQFTGAASTSSNAIYTIRGRSDQKFNLFDSSNTKYCLGALNGTVYQYTQSTDMSQRRSGITLEIGACCTNCTFGGSLSTGSDKIALRKVGTAKLTCSAASIGDVEIVSGVYEVTGNSQNGNITFTGDGTFRSTIALASDDSHIDYAKEIVNSTAPIVFDDGDLDRTWSTAIKSSNTGGFTKKGVGTLTLTAVPQYTGLTTVEEGTLVVPVGTVVTNNALYANNVPVNSTVVCYGYPAGSTIEAPVTSGSVVYDAPLDCAGLVGIDASGVTLVPGKPYVIAAATGIRNWKQVAVRLPDGTGEKWKLKVRKINGQSCLCLVDFDMGSMLMLH